MSLMRLIVANLEADFGAQTAVAAGYKKTPRFPAGPISQLGMLIAMDSKDFSKAMPEPFGDSI